MAMASVMGDGEDGDQKLTILDCDVCWEKYNNDQKIPKVISCGHTFCDRCIKSITKNNRLKCPTCRNPSIASQVDGFPTNFLAWGLINEVQSRTKTTMVSVRDSAVFLEEIQALKESRMETGEKWFAVDLHWYEKMVDFLQGNGDFPGPIDNSGLFHEGTKQLRKSLLDELDYVLMPKQAWNKLRQKFGLVDGQDPISRKVIRCGVFVHHTMVEIYPLQFNLSLYTDPKDVKTVQISRSATPADLKKEARARFRLGSGVQMRLYHKIDEEFDVIPDAKQYDTLHDLCLTGQQEQNIVVDLKQYGKWNI